MTHACPRCQRTMAKHRTLDVWRCTNVNCGLFDRPYYGKPAARVMTENRDSPPVAAGLSTGESCASDGAEKDHCAEQVD